jgi:hypothetical protein
LVPRALVVKGGFSGFSGFSGVRELQITGKLAIIDGVIRFRCL